MKSGAEEAARAVPGVHLVVLAPEREVNIDQQVGILEDQIARGVSALAVAPAGVSEILPVLDRAKAAGIPVLIVDTGVNWPAKLSYIGADNRVGGRIAGEYIVKLLSGKGKVAVIRGILGIATHEERLAGFREAIARDLASRAAPNTPRHDGHGEPSHCVPGFESRLRHQRPDGARRGGGHRRP